MMGNRCEPYQGEAADSQEQFVGPPTGADLYRHQRGDRFFDPEKVE